MSRRQVFFLFLILGALGLRASRALASESNRFWVYGSESASQPHLFGSSALLFAPKVGADYFLESKTSNSWSLGTEYSQYTLPGGIGVGRTDFSLQVGYWIMNQRLGIMALAGSSSNSLAGYSNTSSSVYALGVKYRYPLTSFFSLFIGSSWNSHSKVQFERDTGVPITNSAGLNALCSVLTFSIASSCGDKTQTVNIPSMTSVDFSVGIAIIF